uniref:Cyclin-like domain-containing protein n=2 Tax=Anopheles albimanus TaxID=7167 RepID=A0A182FPU4_ANOAL
MRYANKLDFREKTHEVSMTAQRLVQRMKKDSIHSGRRPSGLCGAALLLAARMHDFGRTPNDIVRIVKIHESTLRKRLFEFGETPSSALTVDEFMAVDLEAEQDPPAFKAARKKDKERLQKLEEQTTEFNQLQAEIDAALDREMNGRGGKRRRSKYDFIELQDSDQFIEESNMSVIRECVSDAGVVDGTADPDQRGSGEPKVEHKACIPEGLKPDLKAMCKVEVTVPEKASEQDDGELITDDLNDDEMDAYIMTEEEANTKNQLWMQLNEEYLKELQVKEERAAKQREEGKPEKKKRRTTKRKAIGPSSTAREAIEKILQEKKISNKINYDILKTLTDGPTGGEPSSATPASTSSVSTTSTSAATTKGSDIDILSWVRQKPEKVLSGGNTTPKTEGAGSSGTTGSTKPSPNISPLGSRKRQQPVLQATLPVVVTDGTEDATKMKEGGGTPKAVQDTIDDFDEEVDGEPEPEPESEHKSLADMLNTGDDDDYYDYEEDY